MDSSSSAIKIENVWKVFGNTSSKALDAIQNKGISKTEALEKYNSVIGVSDVSFDVNQGEIFCVMGLSGSGKSTLVRHINRLLEPTSGKILINGQDVMKLDRDHLQELRNKKIGMVFQNFALMPHRSVVDNIAMPLEIRGVSKNDRLDAANKILEIVELQGWGNKFAHELSGGMQQRVGLARALAADPEFLLMDEPFSALDPLIRRQLQSEFIKLSKQMKKTTVFITHDLDEAVRVGHRIAIMRDGKVIQIGTPEQIVVNPADEYVAFLQTIHEQIYCPNLVIQLFLKFYLLHLSDHFYLLLLFQEALQYYLQQIYEALEQSFEKPYLFFYFLVLVNAHDQAALHLAHLSKSFLKLVLKVCLCV